MTVDLIIKNGKLVSPRNVVEGGVAIDGGIIVAIAKTPNLPDADRVIDARGKVVLPGVLDGHTHTALPPEDSRTGTRAAVRGGVTTILEMPGTQMGCFNPKEFEKKRILYEATSHVDFCLHAGCASGYPEGNLTGMWGMGATGVKFFVSSAGPNWPQTFDGEILDEIALGRHFTDKSLAFQKQESLARRPAVNVHALGDKLLGNLQPALDPSRQDLVAQPSGDIDLLGAVSAVHRPSLTSRELA